jgi:hypothetical protein
MQLHERLEAVSTSRVDGPSKLVLIMLAKRLDRDDPDGVVWSSSETLAKECGVSTKAITRTMERLTKAGIIRIVSKAAQGRSARKAIDWTALAAAERDTSAIENIPAEKRRRVGSRSDEPSDLEATDSRTLERRTVDSRSDAASEDPISEPIMDPIKGTDPQPDHDARGPAAALTDEQPEEPPMHSLLYERVIPGIVTGSKPTTDTDPIDNDGATTHPPDAAGPSLPSTPDAAPATGTGTAPPSPDRAELVARKPEQGAAGASKPKRGKGKHGDETIAAIAAQVDRMMGRTGCALPGSGRWKQLVSAVNEAGAARVLARVTAMADAAQGLPSPAAAIFAAMTGGEYGTGPILRGHNGWTVKLDDALDASALGQKGASEKPGDGGRVDSRPSGQNAPQARQSANGATAWDDMLTTIRATGGLRLSIGLRGSTLSHDPAEHARRCQAVRDIGGWPKLCEMGEGNRGIIRAQFVAAYERVSA